MKFSSLLAVSDVLLYSLRDILDDSLDFAKLSSDVERGTNLPLATNDVVDLTLLMAEITKSTWTRKIRWSSNGSVGGDGDGEHGFEKSEKLDVILEFAERPEGWAAKVNIGELRRSVFLIIFCFRYLAVPDAPLQDSLKYCFQQFYFYERGLRSSGFESCAFSRC